MRRSTTLIVLGIATVVVVAAAVLSRPEPESVERSGERLFPDLVGKINDTAAVEVASGGKTFTLAREDKGWVVPEKSGYPAAATEVRKLLLGMAELRRVEPKTSDPKRYAKLELDDPSEKEASGVRYVIKAKGDQSLASLVIGKRRLATGNPAASALFVRVPGDPQAWLVEGNVPVKKTAAEWLDKQILKIEPSRVRRVRVTHPDGEQVVVEKDAPGDADFRLREIPEGRKLDSQYMVNNVASTLADLSLDDVQPASGVDFEQDRGLTAVVETFDGLRVTMSTRKDGDKTLARLAAAFDPALVTVAKPPAAASTSEEAPKETPAPAESEKGPEGKPDAAAPSKAPEGKADAAKPKDVAKEAETLNARWAGWAYQIPSYQVDDLGKKMADLTTAEKAEEDKDKGS